MNKNHLIIGAALILAMSLSACKNKPVSPAVSIEKSTDVTTILTDVKTTQFFTDEKIADEDIQKILSAGVNAPSAMNTQPWHFTAITDEEVTKQLADAMSNMKPPAMKDGESFTPPEGVQPEDAPKPPEGGIGFSKAPNKAGIGDAPLTIIISCKEGSELDAGLAVQNMSAEAQLLGYGTKIMTAPTMALNTEEYKSMLSVPEGQKIAAVLIIGRAATEESSPDAVSSATTRNDFNDMVTIIGQ